MRDPISFDPIDPPEGVELNDAEKLLWQGRCPWCGGLSSFSPSEDFDGSWVCRACDVEFLGPEEDRPGKPAKRDVSAVYRAGKAAKKKAAANSLPAVTERPGRPQKRAVRSSRSRKKAKAPAKSRS